MNEITYQEIENKRGSWRIDVRSNGSRVGTIRLVEGGFAYFPIGSQRHGDVFKTVREVQSSLEPEPAHDADSEGRR